MRIKPEPLLYSIRYFGRSHLHMELIHLVPEELPRINGGTAVFG